MVVPMCYVATQLIGGSSRVYPASLPESAGISPSDGWMDGWKILNPEPPDVRCVDVRVKVLQIGQNGAYLGPQLCVHTKRNERRNEESTKRLHRSFQTGECMFLKLLSVLSPRGAAGKLSMICK